MRSSEFLLAMSPRYAVCKRLALSILLAIGSGFWALAATGDQCSEIFQAAGAVETPSKQVVWEKLYRDQIVPFYHRKWDAIFNGGYFHEKFLKLKMQGSREILMLEKLGFEVTTERINVPDLPTFIANYVNYLDFQKIPESERILPALTYQRASNPDEIMLRLLLEDWR